MLRRKKKQKQAAAGEVVLPDLEFKPKIKDPREKQGVLISCRAVEQYPSCVVLCAKALRNRADQLMLDYTSQSVSVRFRIDGRFESMPPMDRPTGDGLLVILKKLCELNPADRKSRQQALLPVKYKGDDFNFEFTSQGVPTGERVLIKISAKKSSLNDLESLGMRNQMQEDFRSLLNAPDSMFLFSGIPGHGLPTTWNIGLESADRFIRDFHSIQDKALGEPELINITPHHYDSAAGETPMTVLKSLLLKQPDVLVFPTLPDHEVMSLVVGEVAEEQRKAIIRIQANSAVEAFINLLAKYPKSRKEIAKTTAGVINLRLVRRLCTKCRQAFQPNPQLLKKLGLPPGRIQVLYQPFIPPPPEQRVDANGKPIEIEICRRCNGRGFHGRAAIFELLKIDDDIRKAALSDPNPANVQAVARSKGFLTIQEEGVLAVATGMTSIQEVQAVLSPKRR
ncbi:MAG: ATPase, T2SS/T4P/T4SS family [Planctomycetota bacterium]|nr:ATPase, T2SS/T4P/T4SS family [Planctomycetota bacterium]